MDCTHRTPRFSLSSSIFKALKTTLQFWTPLLLTFHFLHLSLHLLFSYIFFSSSFYLFNLLSSINIFWVTQSLRFSFCILFPSGNSHCGYGSASDERLPLRYFSFQLLFLFWEFCVVLNFNLLRVFLRCCLVLDHENVVSSGFVKKSAVFFTMIIK